MFVAFVFVGLMLAAAVVLLVRSVHRLAETTLLSAQRWAVAAGLVWGGAWGVETAGLCGWTAAWHEVAWFGAGVVALCPAVAVLGAKRPGVRVWTWFVLLPLVAVLTLPILGPPLLGGSSWNISIPTPLVAGFAVVLLMGAGNYVGTRYALAAALYAVAICLVMAPLSDAGVRLPVSPQTLRFAATGCLAAAVLTAALASRRPAFGLHPCDRLWNDYCDTFGVVWGRRMLERVNQRAAAESWDWRLAETGFIPAVSRDSAGSPSDDPRIETALRWLLRRFVDPAWIDQRLAIGRETAQRQAASPA